MPRPQKPGGSAEPSSPSAPVRIEGKLLRASPHYEMVALEQLSSAERERLGGLEDDPEFYGVLRPAAGLPSTSKAAGLAVARLLERLRRPTVLSSAAEFGFEPAHIAGMVMDGVVEVEAGGRFVSGPDAADELLDCADLTIPHSRLARLSFEAVRFAAAADIDDLDRLAAWLYRFNVVPVTPRWNREILDASAAMCFLGVEGNPRLRQRLAAAWRRQRGGVSEGWLAWVRRGSVRSAVVPRFKMYVSPLVEALPETFEAVVIALCSSEATHFKVGSNAEGLLRPDKLVAYFPGLGELREASRDLAELLTGLPAQGVPFTAELVADGLLSWGVDPPRTEQQRQERRGDSWRSWIVYRLAAALLQTKGSSSSAVSPWRFALERLRLHGIDIDRWIPVPGLWETGREA